MTDAGGIPINVDPNLLQLGPILITWHGLFTAVGTLVGIWLAVQWARRAGYTEDDTISVAMWGVVGAIVGARLFHVVDQWSYYSQNLLTIVLLNEGGLAIYGTIVGGPIAGAIYAWRRGLPVARLADVACIPLAFGMAIGRIGDVINGEHHGAQASGFPLAVVYTNPNTLGEIGVPVHLAVGYEMVLDLAVLALLIWMAGAFLRDDSGKLRFAWRPRYPSDAMLFWTWLGLYSIGRFVIQFYRVDTPFALGLSQAQLLSVLSAMIAVWALVYLAGRSRSRRKTVAAPGAGKNVGEPASAVDASVSATSS